MLKLYGIDLDGICFNFLKGFSEWLEEKVGVECPKDEEITSYYWYESIDGLTKDVFWDEFDKFGLANGYRNLELLPGALEGLETIVRAGHQLMYITNRPKYAIEDTKIALARHNFPFRDRLVFADGAKAPIVNDYGVNVFIDDSPRTIAELCTNTQATIYCMDYPMNRGLHDLSNYIRVKSWNEFLECEGLNVAKV